MQRSHPVTLTALMTTGAGTAYLVAGLLGAGGGLRLDLPADAWLVTIAITLTGTIVPFVGFAAATRRVGASTASIVATVQVPFTAVLAALVLGQSPATVQIIGAALVLSAIGVLQARPVPVRWRRRLLAPTRVMRGGLERALPERRPDRGRPVRRAAKRVRRPLWRTRSSDRPRPPGVRPGPARHQEWADAAVAAARGALPVIEREPAPRGARNERSACR